MKEEIKNERRQTIGYAEKLSTKTIIFDDRRRNIGEIRIEAGKQVAYDDRLRRIASYDEKLDVTKDTRLNRIGKGNMLVQVILQNAQSAPQTGKEEIKNERRQTIGYAEKLGTKTLIFDDRRRKVGEIKVEAGKQVAYDAHFRRIACYEERLDVTKDARLNKIGKGNILIQFILQNAQM